MCQLFTSTSHDRRHFLTPKIGCRFQTHTQPTAIDKPPVTQVSPSSEVRVSNKNVLFYVYNIYFTYLHINSRLFPMGLGRNYITPPATILTYSSRHVHIHKSEHTRTFYNKIIYLIIIFTSDNGH